MFKLKLNIVFTKANTYKNHGFVLKSSSF